MLVDRIKNWLFGDRPQLENNVVEVETTMESGFDGISPLVSVEDGFDISEDEEESDEAGMKLEPATSDAEIELFPNISSKKRAARSRIAESEPEMARELEEILLDENGARLRIITRKLGDIGRPIDKPEKSVQKGRERGEFRRKSVEERVREIESKVEKAGEPTLCLIELPNFRSRELRAKFGMYDPKLALRRGLARQGRLTKFISVKKDKVDNLESDDLRNRCNGVVRDGLTMLGYLPALINIQVTSGAKLPDDLYVAGLWQIRMTAKKTQYRPVYLPAMVIMSATQKVPVKIWLPDGKGVRTHYQGLLDITNLTDKEVSWQKREEALDKLRRFLEREAEYEGYTNLTLLVSVQNIRELWRGLNNNNATEDALLLNLGDQPVPLTDLGYHLRIIRLRTYDQQETPEWYTVGATPGKGYTQGVWQLPDQERIFYNIAGKPHTAPKSGKGKQTKPGENYAIPSILEINPIGLQSGDIPAFWANIIDQWRRMGYTYPGMTVLPLPLQWASKLRKYAEVIGPWIFPDQWETEADQEEDDDDSDTASTDESYQLELPFEN